jgi:hypothetical protein
MVPSAVDKWEGVKSALDRDHRWMTGGNLRIAFLVHPDVGLVSDPRSAAVCAAERSGSRCACRMPPLAKRWGRHGGRSRNLGAGSDQHCRLSQPRLVVPGLRRPLRPVPCRLARRSGAVSREDHDSRSSRSVLPCPCWFASVGMGLSSSSPTTRGKRRAAWAASLPLSGATATGRAEFALVLRHGNRDVQRPRASAW